MCIVCMHTTPTLDCSVIVNGSVYAQCTHHNTTLHQHSAADTSVIVNAHCTITLHHRGVDTSVIVNASLPLTQLVLSLFSRPLLSCKIQFRPEISCNKLIQLVLCLFPLASIVCKVFVNWVIHLHFSFEKRLITKNNTEN